jgi:menaquinone-dependent protoporphyrinogen oxidase
MSRILILYSSYDGQTARIANRIGAQLGREGHTITFQVADSERAFDLLGINDAVVIGAAVRVGRYARAFEAAVRERREFLASMPNAFFSVCLSASGPNARPEIYNAPLRNFCKRTGWSPERSTTFAGALPYSKYNPFIRLMMRFIVSRAGGDTDTSRDYEYTDWAAVDRFATSFARSIAPRAKAA